MVLLTISGFSLVLVFWLSWRLRRSDREKKVILEALEEGVIVIDGRERVAYANAAASTMFGIHKRKLIAQALDHLGSHPLIFQCKELLEQCRLHGRPLTDSLIVSDGRKHIDLIALPQKRGVLVILQDKSSHHKVVEMGRDFVANASHELRTPITIIRGFAETLQDFPEISLEMLGTITEKIVRNCQRMDGLIRNLLTLTDIDNLLVSRFRDCDLVALIEECQDTLLSLHPDTILEIYKGVNAAPLCADRDFLELALMNLLDNAVKYSAAPPNIRVEIKREGDVFHLSVADRGIGIPETDLEHIFERFYTVDKAHSRKLGGAGLGLSIVKTIIEKHEGTISAASQLGKGTTFTISLPMKLSP